MKTDTQTLTFELMVSDVTFDPLEEGVRQRVRCFSEAILEEESQAALGRGRYERAGRDPRAIAMGTGNIRSSAPSAARRLRSPARLIDEGGQASERRSEALRRYQRLTKKTEALIASVYLAGTRVC